MGNRTDKVVGNFGKGIITMTDSLNQISNKRI
jgi:hypothetical protein